MADARKGDLVQIHRIVLKPNQRLDSLPACTRSVPYEGWIKGFLLDEKADIGDQVRIETYIGRELSGTLHQVNPVYDHNFGAAQEALLSIGNEAKDRLNYATEE
jgi:hypothetical protein